MQSVCHMGSPSAVQVSVRAFCLILNEYVYNTCFCSCNMCEWGEGQLFGFEGYSHHLEPCVDHRSWFHVQSSLYVNLVVSSLKAGADTKVALPGWNYLLRSYLLNIIFLVRHRMILCSFWSVPCEYICSSERLSGARDQTVHRLSALLEGCIVE